MLLLTLGSALTCPQVMITLLQHTHRSLPHYEDKEWDWLRGALATVDRSYGIFDYFHHHVGTCHAIVSNLGPRCHASHVEAPGTPATDCRISNLVDPWLADC